MTTISEVVNDLVSSSPFLGEALSDKLINVSSLARKLKPQIEQALGKEVKLGAVIMAINRMNPSYYRKINTKLRNYVYSIGDIVIRTNLDNYTFYNSDSLIDKQTQLLSVVKEKDKSFCTFSQGVHETTIIVSHAVSESLEKIFKNEKLLLHIGDLSSITVKLPLENTEIFGLYYYIFKKLAWDGINVTEVISTANELTIIVKDEYVHKSFSIIKELKVV